jgi:hypothetical protein
MTRLGRKNLELNAVNFLNYSDKVNSSDKAYALGVPDGTLSLVSLAANISMAAFGGENRTEQMPLVPIAAAGKAIIEAAVASWFFTRCRQKKKPGADTVSWVLRPILELRR